jgi:hypothetical protein
VTGGHDDYATQQLLHTLAQSRLIGQQIKSWPMRYKLNLSSWQVVSLAYCSTGGMMRSNSSGVGA